MDLFTLVIQHCATKFNVPHLKDLINKSGYFPGKHSLGYI